MESEYNIMTAIYSTSRQIKWLEGLGSSSYDFRTDTDRDSC